jgi:CxxC motif-containing protein (DUF1111 family)
MPRPLPAVSLALSAILFAACNDASPPAAPAASSSTALERTLPKRAAPRSQDLGEPLDGLTPAQRRQFEQGRLVFDRQFTPESGLGPLYNSFSCAECHEDPTSGGVGDEVELHASAYHSDGSCDQLTSEGGFVIQQLVTPALQAALGIDHEPTPPHATALAHRTTGDIFGFGLLDAVPDSLILRLARYQRQLHNGISGRPNRLSDGRIGRFGRKAQVATLREFIAGAFQNEMGITSPEALGEPTIGGQPFPSGVDPLPEPELSQRDLDFANAFVRFLKPPTHEALTEEAERGRTLFSRLECATCHVPKLVTGDSPVAALRHREVFAFTDLLLHNMGPEMADICLEGAKPPEFRTAPLMGLRFRSQYLHDGRAHTLEEAIELHGGEGATARDQFRGLSATQRAALLAYLGSL